MAEVIDEAFERCIGEPARSGYDLRTARRSLNLLFADWANRGVNLWTMDSGTITMLANTPTYLLPADTVDLLDCVIRTNPGSVTSQADLAMTRISESTYATIPNKLSPGRPIQFWVQRLGTPQVTVWQVPADSTSYTLVYWRLRRIQDAVGSASITMDMPFRFYPPLISGLAYYLSIKLPKAVDRVQLLKTAYDEDWSNASDEDRDKASVRFVPRVIR